MKTIDKNLAAALHEHELNPCNKCWYHFPIPVAESPLLNYHYECQACGQKGETAQTLDGALLAWNKFNPLNYEQHRLNKNPKTMKISELKVGDLIKIKSTYGHPAE